MSQSEEMAAFVRISERGGFAAAARASALTPSALSKLVSRLERRLGVRLLHRTTRRLALTAEGEIYLARARDIIAQIEAAEAEVTAGLARPRGHLRVNTGSAFAKHRLLPALPEFLTRYPDITFDLAINDRRVDAVAEQADVLLRVGVLDDSSLVARKLTEVRRVICASPEYLARHGMPTSPAELAGHECVVLRGLARLTAWPFRQGDAIVPLPISGRLTCDGADALLDMALAGLGIIRVTDFLVERALAEGRLRPVLEDVHASERLPLWALMPPGRSRMPRVKAVVDFVAERCI